MKENRTMFSSRFDKDIRGKGVAGATKVSGRYTENKGQKDERKVGERSHVISSGKMGKKRFEVKQSSPLVRNTTKTVYS